MPVAVSGDTLAAAQLPHQMPLRDVSIYGRRATCHGPIKCPRATRIARLEFIHPISWSRNAILVTSSSC